jgi:hypothetical protein
MNWAVLSSGPLPVDPETVGMPGTVRMPDDVGEGGPDGVDLVDTTELLEVLLCPECDSELGAPQACGATHLYLADNPLMHRLLRPLVEQYLRSLASDKMCRACSAPDAGGRGHDVQLARGECRHVTIREGQVTMARDMWDAITAELDDLRVRTRTGSGV